MIFVGYQDDSENYLLFHQDSKTVTVSKNVSFNESYTRKSIKQKFVEILLPSNPLIDNGTVEEDEEDEELEYQSVNEIEDEKTDDGKNDEIEKIDRIEQNDESNNVDNEESYNLRDRKNIQKPIRYQANIA